MRIGGGDAVGKFMKIQFAEQHRALALEPRPYGGVVIGNEVGEDFRAASGENAVGIAKVLERDGNSMKGAAPMAADNFLFGLRRVVARGVGGDRDVGVDLLADLLDALEISLRDLDRGELAGTDFFGEGGNVEAQDVVHRW